PEQELVVGGWTPGEGAASDLGALVVGYYEGAGKAKKLHFAGKVGSGFNAQTRRRIRERLKPLATEDSPFDPPPPKDYKGRWGGELRNVVWVKPEIVIRAELGGWTRDGIVRQAAFKGFDEGGKPPTQVVRERPVEAKPTVEAVEATLPQEEQDDPMPDKAKRPATGGRRGTAAGGRSPRPSANPSTASVRAGRGSGPRGRSASAAGTHE